MRLYLANLEVEILCSDDELFEISRTEEVHCSRVLARGPKPIVKRRKRRSNRLVESIINIPVVIMTVGKTVCES